MQLSLLSRTAPSSAEARTGPSTQPGAWRDSAISQLDTLAATNERVALQSLPGRVFAAAGLLVAAVLGAAVLWPTPGQNPSARAATAPALAAAVVQVAPSAPADPVPGAGAGPLDAIAAAPVSDESSLPAAAGSDDEDARKARAVRRKAALLAQERERADEEARRQMQALATQREDAERARQDEARQAQADAARERAAAEQARRVVAAAPAPAPAARRGVAEQCAGSGGVASEQACHVRACWKSEHRADPVCVQLREADALRLQRGTEH
jgi:hypothetical protein